MNHSTEGKGIRLVVLALVCLVSAGRAHAATADLDNTGNPADAPGATGIDSATLGATRYRNTRYDFGAAAPWPPQDDGLAITTVADKTKRSAEYIVASAYGSGSTAGKSDSPAVVFGLNLADINFEDDNFTGSGPTLGFTLGASFDDRYEIGFEYSSSAILDFLFDDTFYFEPSIDEGRDLVDFEDAYLRSKLLYLRGNWRFSEKFAGFALVGYSQIELEIEKTDINCGLLIFLPPLCASGDVDTFTTYSNDASGYVWGVGLEWNRSPHSYLSLRYIDQSVDDFDYSGISFALGLRD